MTDAATVRVLVVDDEPLVRHGISSILGSDPAIDVVGEAADGAGAVAAVRSMHPDVVCMDVRMPDVNGIRATELVLALPDPPKVLVVTTFGSDDQVVAALRAGASGFVLKRAEATELIGAVHAVATGDGILFPASVRDLVLRQAVRPTYDGEPLTARERQVLELMAEGLANAAIASRLVLGVETVRTHVASVLRKLRARDRTHAVVLAYSQGLVRMDGR